MEIHMIEYPKALYLNGACLNVDGPEQEATARDDGYTDWHTDFDRLSAPDDNGHIEAIKQPLEQSLVAEALDRAALKVRAAELGIEHAPNIKTDKLAALVAAAQP